MNQSRLEAFSEELIGDTDANWSLEWIGQSETSELLFIANYITF